MNSPIARPVAVGVDGRPGSAGALRYAVTEARRRQAPLELVHVVPDSYSVGPVIPWTDLHGIGADILDQEVNTAQRMAPDLTINSELVVMDRGGGIVKAAESAQLVVVGRETRHGLDRLLTGTTTAKVAANAACEVVVVPSFWVDDHPHGRVVVGIKSSNNTHELLAQAFTEASARGAVLTAVVAWQASRPVFRPDRGPHPRGGLGGTGQQGDRRPRGPLVHGLPRGPVRNASCARRPGTGAAPCQHRL